MPEHGEKGKRYAEFTIKRTGGTVSIKEHKKGATVKCHVHGTTAEVASWSKAWPVARKPGDWCSQCVGYKAPQAERTPEEKAEWKAEMDEAALAKKQERNAAEIAETRAQLEALLERRPALAEEYDKAATKAARAETIEDINKLFDVADRLQNSLAGSTIQERRLRAKLAELGAEDA